MAIGKAALRRHALDASPTTYTGSILVGLLTRSNSTAALVEVIYIYRKKYTQYLAER